VVNVHTIAQVGHAKPSFTEYQLNDVRFQRIRAAKERLMSFFLNQIAQRKEEMGGRVGSTRKSRASDVFTMLVEANESDNEKSKLTIQELVRCYKSLGMRVYLL